MDCRSIIRYVYKKVFRIILFILPVYLNVLNVNAASFYLLKDYYSILHGKYKQSSLPLYLLYENNKITHLSEDLKNDGSKGENIFMEEGEPLQAELNLEGEIELNLMYGGDFSLKRGIVVGAGSAGITQGLKYDLIEKIILEGKIGEQLNVELNYDSERSEEGIIEEKNTYSLLYEGREGEFISEASLGNKYLSIDGGRYVPIDEGNQNSFALRGKAGIGALSFEGLLRYDVAFEGKKQFKGFKKSVDFSLMDIDYVKGRYFFIPDTSIDEITLLIYKSSDETYDKVVDQKRFVLLSRGVDYDFDNSTGFIYLNDSLDLKGELLVYYEKSGITVGSDSLGQNGIINTSGSRENFNVTSYPEYFGSDGSKNYLYLKKGEFNSYWELRNIYPLEEIEGKSVYNVQIDLLFTANGGINGNYESLLNSYEIEVSRGIIIFTFSDALGFYPRPFPGEFPFTDPTNPLNPFDSLNPIYGGLNYPQARDSINTLRIRYSYDAESFFLDFNIIPGSVSVLVNGNPLESKYFEIDYPLGIISFSEGIVGPSSDLEITYRYTTFGAGDRGFFSALGVKYDTGILQLHNITSFSTALKGIEAPQIGGEGGRVIKNSTELSLDLIPEKEEGGFFANLKGGFALSYSNKNVHGSAIVADMEREDFHLRVDLGDENWFLASKSLLLTSSPYNLSFGNRGSVYFKNYWRKSIFSGDILESINWNIPEDQVFEYGDKAGPYNTADKPEDGEDKSLVIDYEFAPGSTNPYVSIVTPIAQENLSAFESIGMILRGEDINSEGIVIYVEVLKIYEEDINGNDVLDGEGSINDRGYKTIPIDGEETVLGTDSEGKSNGRIDSEDLNKNGYLDPLSSFTTDQEKGAVIEKSIGIPYLIPITQGDSDWQYPSFNILDIINNNLDIFQYVTALRITVKTDSSSVPNGASGKILINKIWFSGSSMINNSKDNLNVTEISVNEDPEMKNNAFSKTYPGIYSDLHGDPAYRQLNELEEKLLRVEFSGTLSEGSIASLSMRFGFSADLTPYREFRIFIYLPSSQSLPSQLNLTMEILSSENEKLVGIIPQTNIKRGWNEIYITLQFPYKVKVNGVETGNMVQTGALNILKRATEIRFGFKAESGDITESFEVWLDEWYLTKSTYFFDKAAFAEGTLGYRGSLVSLFSFPIFENPSLALGYERKEGNFYKDTDFKSDKYFTGLEINFLKYLKTNLFYSTEKANPIRNEEVLTGNLNPQGSEEQFSHSLELNLRNQYIPVLQQSYERRVTSDEVIELTKTDYRYRKKNEYNESIKIGEYVNLPFGLQHSYFFSRSWLFFDTFTGTPETGFVLNNQKSASLNQIHDGNLSYLWESNSISFKLLRNETFTGLYTPYSQELFRSYTFKIESLFQSPKTSLKNAIISSRSDNFGIDFSVPVKKRLGFYVSLEAGFTESNFNNDLSYRDIKVEDSINLSLPFHPLGEDRIKITPGIERNITGEYKRTREVISETDVLMNTYKFILMPPLYYMLPVAGLGRIKDYNAVDTFKGSSQILGDTSNTLTNTYNLETSLQYEKWYIPRYINFSLMGETKREGENYLQKRAHSIELVEQIPLKGRDKFFERNLNFNFNYKNEKNYSTKVLENSFGIDSELSLLREERRGVKAGQSLTYTRERQKINDEDFLLFPGDPEREVQVSYKPPIDKIENKLVLRYLWEYNIERVSLFSSVLQPQALKGLIQNEEGLIIENIYVLTNREKSESFSNIPFRLSLEHNSSYHITDSVEFGFIFKTTGGVEEKVIPPSVKGNILPSMGLEIGINAKIIF